MNATVMVYQQKEGEVLRWTTLGLGELTHISEGRNRTRLRQTVTDKLRDAVAKADAGALRAFDAPTGMRLERLRLELNLRGEGRRSTVTGVFPLVIVPYAANADEKFTIAYHPRRQQNWFPVDVNELLETQAKRFFEKEWADLEERQVLPLRTNGKDSLHLLSFVGRPRDAFERLNKEEIWGDLESEAQRRKRLAGMTLRSLATNLTLKAVDGALALGRPRSPAREQLLATLGAERPRSVLVVGPPGVGKSTVIRRWIADLAEADGFEVHRNTDKLREVWEISGKRIIAGMSYVGEWQQRCLDLQADLTRGGRRRYLYVDDIHLWGRLGQSRDSDASFAAFFQPTVARGDVTIVGECTPGQLQRLEEEASNFAQRFTLVRLQPTTRDETLRMALQRIRELELKKSGLYFEAPALSTAIDVGGSLMTSRAMPSTALELLSDLARLDTDYEPIGPTQLIKHLSQRTGLPIALVAPDKPLLESEVEAALSRQVAGQPEAIRAATDLVLRIRSGLTDPRRPYAVYLFSGPTGTGKTELARSLAAYLYGDESRLIRIDSGEYATPDAHTRLVGDGFRPEGTLTSAVRAQPFSVVLFDEVEKAHPRVLNLLLQVCEDGRLTDANGHVADFTHAVLILTSNLGAQTRAPIGLGGRDATQTRLDSDRAIREFFAPEMFNRLDRVVHFAPLSREACAAVVEKELAKLLSRRGLTGRNVFVTVDDAVKDIVVRHAFDERYGARPLKRWLEDHVGAKLSEHLAAEPNATLQLVQISGQRDALFVDAFALHPMPTRPGRSPLEPLAEQPIDRLRDALPAAAARVEEVRASDVFQRLSEAVRVALAAHNKGDRAQSDRVHDLERFRQRVFDVEEALRSLQVSPVEEEREWLEFERFNTDTIPLRNTFFGGEDRVRRSSRQARARSVRHSLRDDLLQTLADAAFLQRALRFVEAPGEGAALIDICRVGQPRQEGRFETTGSQLVQWLADAYRTPFGACEDQAFRYPDGITAQPREGVAPEQVILRVVGLCARDLVSGEEGSHVWSSLGRLPEVVQVRVLPFDGRSAREALEANVALKREFQAKRTRGEATGLMNPFLPPPVIRTYRFEPPVRAGDTAPLEIEDYGIGYVKQVRVHALAEALATPWLLRRSWAGDA